MGDVELNGQRLVTTSATTSPAALTSETWTVTALPVGIPTLTGGGTYALTDVTLGSSAGQQAEIARVTAATAGATSITVTRGVDGTTPVAHAATATFAVVQVASAYNLLPSTYAAIGAAGALGPPVLSPLVGVLGDSLSQNTDIATRRTDSPLATATLLSGGKIRYTYMGGVAGQTSAQILARVNDFVATGAKTIVIQCGVNDGNGGWGTTTRTNLDAIIAGVISRGGVPVLATTPPSGSSGSPPSTATKLARASYNEYVRNKSASLGTPIVDYYAALADPTGDYFLAAYNNDGIHPNAAGWALVGQALCNALLPLLPAANPVLPFTNTDQASKSTNCLMLNSSAGFATNWSRSGGSGNGTPTVVAAPVGNWQLMTSASSPGNSSCWIQAIPVTAGNLHRLVFVASWSGTPINVQIDTISSGATSYSAYVPMFGSPTYSSPMLTVTGAVCQYDFTPAAGVDHINVEMIVQSGTGTAQWSQFAVYDITAINAV
jgi:lysophospholipase L1-like esterase